MYPSSSKDKYSDSNDSYRNHYSESQKKYYKRYSRSRSPVHSSKQQDFQKRRSKIVSINEELYEKKIDLLDEKKKLTAKLKDIKKRIQALKEDLEYYKSSTQIFLPCSHHKIVNTKYKQLLDSTFAKAVEKLTEEQMKNEIVLRQLKSKVFYSLESRYCETFKCTQIEKFTNEKCGHKGQAECHEIKKFMKQAQWPLCTAKIEHIFECGHAELIQCQFKNNSKCSRCS